MTQASQRHKREIHGVDASGWDGSTPIVANATPITTAAPGGGNIAVNLVDQDGAPITGVSIAGVTSDAGVVTVVSPEVTDVNGDISMAYTTVASGSAYVQLSYPGSVNTIFVNFEIP